MSAPLLSVVVTAPHGFEACEYLDELLSEADGQTLEVVVADGASHDVDRSRLGLRHVSAPGCGIHGLIRAGIRHATGEWAVVTEDHCRTLPEFIESYRDAIRQHPDVDLFSGAVDNLTSPSPWAASVFMIGLRSYWTKATRPPRSASNANLMVRRSALLASELESDGGVLILAVRRLIRSGRYRHCPEAIVDHVLDLSWSQAVRFQYHCTAGVITVNRDTLPTPSAPIQFIRDCREMLICTAVVPWLIVSQFRGTSQSGLASALRLTVLGFAVGLATIAVDLKRLMRRQHGATPWKIEI